jgi:hypothetical protein
MHNHPAKEKFRGKECGNDIRFLLHQLLSIMDFIISYMYSGFEKIFL